MRTARSSRLRSSRTTRTTPKRGKLGSFTHPLEARGDRGSLVANVQCFCELRNCKKTTASGNVCEGLAAAPLNFPIGSVEFVIQADANHAGRQFYGVVRRPAIRAIIDAASDLTGAECVA